MQGWFTVVPWPAEYSSSCEPGQVMLWPCSCYGHIHFLGLATLNCESQCTLTQDLYSRTRSKFACRTPRHIGMSHMSFLSRHSHDTCCPKHHIDSRVSSDLKSEVALAKLLLRISCYSSNEFVSLPKESACSWLYHCQQF